MAPMDRYLPVLAILLALVGCGAGGGPPDPPPAPAHVRSSVQVTAGTVPTIFAVNKSAADQGLFRAYITAQNRQLAEEFSAHWGFTARLEEATDVHTQALNLLVLDNLSSIGRDNLQGTREGNFAYCNYAASLKRGTWQVSCSHEVLELLAESAGITREICDPVAPYSYSGILADFTLPNYAELGSSGPWDYLGKVTKQGTPAPGGI